MKIAFLLYPTARVKVDEDSSFWIMLELQRRGHSVSYFESADLSSQNGRISARLTPACLDPQKGYLPSPKSSKNTDLETLDCLFIRKEPPFGTEYLYSLQALETLKSKVFVLNDPAGIALCNEKSFVLRFPGFAPDSLVTNNPGDALRFFNVLRSDMVVKPLDNKGGAGIIEISKQNPRAGKLLERATLSGKKSVILQRFVSAAIHGDKRILILNGKILGAFLRKPAKGEFRANLSLGGSMHPADVTPREKQLVKAITPELQKNGLWFTGIDVIGGYLTEINVTSPAGIPEIHHFNHTKPELQVADFIERKVRGRG